MIENERPSEIFPVRLRVARVLRDLSQGELAGKAKLPPSSISHFESGKRKPSFDSLNTLANALKVTIDYLLGRVDEPEGHSSISDRMYRDVKNLNAEDQELAEGFLEILKNRGKKE